ncbi:RelE toxin protein [Erwinia typographi]|uniref:RelE toxin protein n=1 Tax=Erwinia typographi TaxID=371042 RepID=A0A0A4ACG7_9GAMM|nr:type II toxin-antitoxin system RelE/ParE family toxin [Erwinia typographi]KGT95528.1 RelE toxin protein [Erwinia typographi]
MFEVIFHDDAETEFRELPVIIRAKMARLLKKLEVDPRSLREPHCKPLSGGLYEIRTIGGDIARGLWVYQEGGKIYLLRVFIKKTPKTPPTEIRLAWKRLEDFKDER